MMEILILICAVPVLVAIGMGVLLALGMFLLMVLNFVRE